MTRLLNNNNETTYREEVGTLTVWCQVDNLSLNFRGTKQLIVDFRRSQAGHAPILTNMAELMPKFDLKHKFDVWNNFEM
jgi:hypothetical protein